MTLGLERNPHPMLDTRLTPVNGVWNGETLVYTVEDDSVWSPASLLACQLSIKCTM
jgi:hypothetical protein